MVDETYSFLARPGYIFVGCEGVGKNPTGAKFWFGFCPDGEQGARQHAFKFMKNGGPVSGHRFEWVCDDLYALHPQAEKVADLTVREHIEVDGNQKVYGAKFYACFYHGDLRQAKSRAERFRRTLTLSHGDCVEIIAN